MLNNAKITTFTERTYRQIQASYLIPSVNNIWLSKRQDLVQDCAGRNLKLGGDGRCCSPGHTAKYGSYSLMDLETGLILDMQLVQVTEVKNSYVMELEGLCRGLQALRDCNLKISDLTTDRHVQVRKYLANEQPDIRHWFDVWHMAKGIDKKILAIANKKGCEQLHSWSHSISNHMYWAAASSGGDEQLVTEKWTSITNHVCNIHNNHGDRYRACNHGVLAKDWILKGSKVHKMLIEIVCNERLLKDIKKLSPAEQTSSLEANHKLVCQFAPKFQHFFYGSMKARLTGYSVGVSKENVWMLWIQVKDFFGVGKFSVSDQPFTISFTYNDVTGIMNYAHAESFSIDLTNTNSSYTTPEQLTFVRQVEVEAVAGSNYPFTFEIIFTDVDGSTITDTLIFNVNTDTTRRYKFNSLRYKKAQFHVISDVICNVKVTWWTHTNGFAPASYLVITAEPELEPTTPTAQVTDSVTSLEGTVSSLMSTGNNGITPAGNDNDMTSSMSTGSNDLTPGSNKDDVTSPVNTGNIGNTSGQNENNVTSPGYTGNTPGVTENVTSPGINGNTPGANENDVTSQSNNNTPGANTNDVTSSGNNGNTPGANENDVTSPDNNGNTPGANGNYVTSPGNNGNTPGANMNDVTSPNNNGNTLSGNGQTVLPQATTNGDDNDVSPTTGYVNGVETTNVQQSTMVSVTNVSSDIILCTSPEDWNRPLSPTELELVLREIQKLREQLLVKKTSLQSYKMTKVSANDDRTSSQGIGSISALFVACFFGLILISDLPAILRELKKTKQLLFKDNIDSNKGLEGDQ